MRFVLYNPMSLVSVARAHDIKQAIHCELAIFPGLQRPYHVLRGFQELRMMIHFCWTQVAFTNKSEGFALAMGKTFVEHHVVRIAHPGAKLEGHCGLVRLRDSQFDLTCIGAYLPPWSGGTSRQHLLWKKTGAVINWVNKQLAASPFSCWTRILA